MRRMPRPHLALSLAFALAGAAAGAALAQPTLVVTAEGQIGETPAAEDRVIGSRLVPVRGQAADVLLGGLTLFGGAVPPPPEFSFLLDQIHGAPTATQVGSVAALFGDVIELPPSVSRTRNAADDGDFVAFCSALDGANPQTMTVQISTFDESGSTLNGITIDNIPTFPDPSLNDTGVAVDDQGRVTVAYTELTATPAARVVARRFDAITGLALGALVPITGEGRAATDVALLDPAGNRLLIPNSDFATIRGNILDTTGPVPTVLPDFPISTTPAIFANLNPAVGSDPESGIAVVAWENISAQQGDPINVRARRFDAAGNPIGADFRVNTTTANAQAQPAVAVGPGGLAAIVWASEPGVAGNVLDVFVQVYDAEGNPIGGETRANTTTDGVQDKPDVRFLPEPDGQGRPQFLVSWRDVAVEDGSNANGTGTGYKCFSIEGFGEPEAIFADGFESGDTSSWSATNP